MEKTPTYSITLILLSLAIIFFICLAAILLLNLQQLQQLQPWS